MRTTVPTAVGVLAALILTGLVLSGRGSGTGAPEGWRALEAGGLRVLYPKGEGWSRLSGDELGGNTATAVLERDGAEVAKISVREHFTRGEDIGQAVANAVASLRPGTTVTRSQRLTIDGRRAEKVEYGYSALFSPGGAHQRHGRAIPTKGVDVVALDSRSGPVLVRVTTARGGLNETQLRRVINSVTLEG